jgi:hypothetical protein
MDVWIQTQSAAVASRHTINLATLDGGLKEVQKTDTLTSQQEFKMSENNHQPTNRKRKMPSRTNLILRSFENHIS